MPTPTSREDFSPTTGRPDTDERHPREPYEPPKVTLIDGRVLQGQVETKEGELYRRFSELADRAEAFFDKMVAFEVELRACSEALDALNQDRAKVAFIKEVKG